MSLVEKIRQSILADFQKYTVTFADALSTDNPMLMNINDYVLQKSGDRLRPTLALLSAKLCGDINTTTINGALSLELLYIASLIHDDVVDEALEQKETSSLQNRWTNKIAILSGDYILSKSLGCGTATDNLAILKAIASIGMELSDGELLKLDNFKIKADSETNYLKYISKKTAFMFATCAEVGGLSANASSENLTHLRDFGTNLGMCYQLKQEINNLHKDIEDGKLTYPLIHTLLNSNSPSKTQILQWVNEQSFSPDNSSKIQSFTLENGGISSTEKLIEHYKQEAKKALSNFPESGTKSSLLMCLESVTSEKL